MNNGRIISLIEHWEKKELEQLKKNQVFICPACQERVQMKVGSKRLWHFAHVSKQHCKLQLENESEYHLQGKKKLYEWLREQGIAVELEAYIPKIKQRPDLLVQWNNQTYAIEYQCSTISADVLIKRTKNYSQVNSKTIWILGGTRLKRGVQQNIIRPSSFDLQMIFRNKTNNMNLIYFCSSTNRFFIASSLMPFTKTLFFTNGYFYKTNKISFSSLLQYKADDPIEFHSTWLILKKRWRTSTFLHAQDYIKRWFYEQGVPLCTLPGEVGIPNKSMLWIKTEVILWQGWILINFIHPLKRGESISFSQIYKHFKKEVTKGHFEIRNLLNFENSHYSFAIMEYLQLLTKLGILRSMEDKTSFQKVNAIVLPNNVEEACSQDKRVLEKIFILR